VNVASIGDVIVNLRGIIGNVEQAELVLRAAQTVTAGILLQSVRHDLEVLVQDLDELREQYLEF
jgi:hypothetical protein